MADRRRTSRPLNNVPQTELELLWDISERLTVVETDLAEYKEDKKRRNSTRALIWTNTFVVASIVTNLIIHYLPTK